MTKKLLFLLVLLLTTVGMKAQITSADELEGEWVENATGWYYTSDWETFSIENNPVTVSVSGSTATFTGLLGNSDNVVSATIDMEAMTLTFTAGQAVYYDDYSWEMGYENSASEMADLVGTINDDGTITLDGINVFYSGFSYFSGAKVTLSPKSEEPVLVKTYKGTYESYSDDYPNFTDEANNVVEGFEILVEEYSDGSMILKNWMNNEGYDVKLAFNANGYVKSINGSTSTSVKVNYAPSSYAYMYTGSYSNLDGNDLYLSLYTNGDYANYNIVLEEAVLVTLNPTRQYTTFCSKSSLDFTDNSAVKAYSAKMQDGSILLTEVNQVPAGVGVVLKNLNQSASAFVSVTETPGDVADNELYGVSEPMEMVYKAGDGNYNYVLSNGAFHPVIAGTTLAAGKAYLQIPYDATAATVKALTLVEAENATAINSVRSTAKTAIYNLNGIRVQTPVKGLYIVNGKKVAY